MAGSDNLTPMMRQYREAKASIPPDAVLLFRLGDFYEEFFEDAERVFETNHPELRYAVASQRAVGFYESLKDYNENASLWVAWFEGEKPADLAAFIQQEIEKAEASVEE